MTEKRPRTNSFDSMDTNTSEEETCKRFRPTVFHVMSANYHDETFSAMAMSAKDAKTELANKMFARMFKKQLDVSADEFIYKNKFISKIKYDEYYACSGTGCDALIPTTDTYCGGFTCITEDARNDEVAVLVSRPPENVPVSPVRCDIPFVETPPPLTMRVPRCPHATLRKVIKGQAFIRGCLVRIRQKKKKRP